MSLSNAFKKFMEPVEPEPVHSFRVLFSGHHWRFFETVRLEIVEIKNGFVAVKVKSKNEHEGKICVFYTHSLLFKRCSRAILQQLKPKVWIEVKMEQPYWNSKGVPIPYIIASRAPHRKTLINDKR